MYSIIAYRHAIWEGLSAGEKWCARAEQGFHPALLSKWPSSVPAETTVPIEEQLQDFVERLTPPHAWCEAIMKLLHAAG